jgi:hypothetical protein
VYHRDTEIIFPMRAAAGLRDLRGNQWKHLVNQASDSAEASEDQLAFSLLLIRLSGCLTCHPSSYRAMKGCATCSKHSVRRYRGEDSELINLYNEALVEVREHIDGNGSAPPVPVD